MQNIYYKEHRHLSSLKCQWRELESKNTSRIPFNEYKFNELVYRVCRFRFLLRGESFSLFEFYEFDGQNKKTLLIIPLRRRKVRKGGQRYHYSLLADVGGTSHLDAIGDPNASEEKIAACFNLFLKQAVKDKSFLELNGLTEESLLYRYLAEKSDLIKDRASVSAYIGNNYDAYFASLSKNARQNLRTAYNRMTTDSRSYKVEFYHHDNLNKKLSRELDKIHHGRLLAKNYLKEGHSFLDRIRAYVKQGRRSIDIISDAMEKKLIGILFIDNEPAAYFRAVVSSKSIILLLFSINMDYTRYSPGMVLVNETAKHLAALPDEVKTLDFSYGPMPYKLTMGGGIYQHHILHLHIAR